MEQAIERLTDLLLRTRETPARGEDLLVSVLGREAAQSTCLGGGLLVSQGILPEGSAMAGVMALPSKGLPSSTPDGRPVHWMVLLATANEDWQRHFQGLATLARTVGVDRAFQAQLFDARSPAHAYELIHGEESEDFNYSSRTESALALIRHQGMEPPLSGCNDELGLAAAGFEPLIFCGQLVVAPKKVVRSGLFRIRPVSPCWW